MRLVMSGFLATSLLAAQPAAAQPCARPADKAAFDVAGLKSQLMVTALSCSVREQYNAFVSRYQPELRTHEKALSSYFNRSFGRRGQKEHDDYITSLANAQSHVGIQQGTLFCRQNTGLFDEVLKLPPGADLAGFAAGKSLTQAIALTPCGQPGPKAPTRTAATQQPAAAPQR